MKKIVITILILLVGLVLGGCNPVKKSDLGAEPTQMAEDGFSIADLSIDYTEIELTDGTNGNIVVLNQEQATGLYDMLKNIPFQKTVLPSIGPGWSYSIEFMKNGIISESIVIKDEITISYKDAIYQASAGTINMDYLSSLLNYSFRAEVISTGETLLVTPSEDSNEAKSSDKIAVSLADAQHGKAQLTDAKGAAMTKEELKQGDIIVVTYNGAMAESYPAQITASHIEVVAHDDLIDGYLALIDEIYQEDSGLNGEIQMIAFDTSDWKLLTGIQKQMIFTDVKDNYGIDTMEGTYEELVAQGLIDDKQLYFEKGILIKITDLKYDKEKKEITCAISKWRGGLGAVGSDKVTAILSGEGWKITQEGSWIS